MDYQNDFTYIEYHIVDHCNLNCAYCHHYAPLVKEPVFRNLESFENDLKLLQNIVGKDHWFQFKILGGEPLLHPDCLEFFELIRKYFPIATLELLTNGILLPDKDQAFFNRIKNLEITIIVSNYFKNNKIKEYLDKYNIEYFYCDKTEVMLNEELNFKPQNNKIYYTNKEDCVCTTLRDGKLYKCPYMCWSDYLIDYFNLDINYDRTLDELNLNQSTYEDILKFINNPINFCKFCSLKIPDKMFNYNNWKVSDKKLEEWVSDY